MTPLAGKHVVLGVTGGIAAYKSAELTRRLREADAEVRVVMTRGATQFIAPLTMQALSGNPVHEHLLDPAAEAGMGHIQLARWADVILIAPASAHLMARLTHGLADDLLTTLCLATSAPIVLAPAMNQAMWQAAATQANRAMLLARGVHLVGPACGSQACGDTGPGRMVEPEELAHEVAAILTPPALPDVRVLVTAGPTREEIDPVRFLSNRSSGKMGFAIAAAAAEQGAQVSLISGPVSLETPRGVVRVDVRSAQEMLRAVLAALGQCDILVACAAVADYRPAQRAHHKLKKSSAHLTLELERTEDILDTVAALPHRPFTVGFAAETHDLDANARDKLSRKRLDMVAANWVGGQETGFESDENSLHVLWGDGHADLPRGPKPAVARALVKLIAARFRDAGERRA